MPRGRSTQSVIGIGICIDMREAYYEISDEVFLALLDCLLLPFLG